MSDLERALSAHLATHHGVVDRSGLLSIGFTFGRIRTLIDSGRIKEVHRAVYVSAASPTTNEQRLGALVLATEGVVSHTSAGQLRDLRKLGRFRSEIHLTRQHGRHLQVKGATIHESRHLDVADYEVRDDGITLTTVARTIYDLAGMLRSNELESVIEQALDRKLVTLDELREVCDRLPNRRRPGGLRLSDVVESRGDKPSVASDYELRFEAGLVKAGLVDFVRQMPLILGNGKEVHPDFADPNRRFVIEVDHATWHGGRAAVQYDQWRDRQYRLLGWHCERVTEQDIDHALSQTLREIKRLRATRPVWRDKASPEASETRQTGGGAA